MGTSIYGYVEIRKYHSGFDDWFPIIDVGIAMTGNYDIFGCLFGVRNYANFKPLFPSRGFPSDCSEEIVKEAKEGNHKNISWCSYAELLSIDLGELSEKPDQRYSEEKRTDKGMVRLKQFPSNEAEKRKCRYIARREALEDPEYHQLLELMGVLSRRYGNDGVRMVVYFD